MNLAANAALTAFREELLEKCQAQETGTMFLASEENKSGRIVLDQGHVIGITYGGRHNTDALDLIALLESIRYSFTAGPMFPLAHKIQPEEGKSIEEQLGLDTDTSTIKAEHFCAPCSSVANSRVNSQFYRGQEVIQEKRESKPEKKSSCRLPRIYRGLVVS